MARKGKSTAEIIAALREAEVRIGQGETVGKICRSLEVSEQTYYKWRRKYGGRKRGARPDNLRRRYLSSQTSS